MTHSHIVHMASVLTRTKKGRSFVMALDERMLIDTAKAHLTKPQTAAYVVSDCSTLEYSPFCVSEAAQTDKSHLIPMCPLLKMRSQKTSL